MNDFSPISNGSSSSSSSSGWNSNSTTNFTDTNRILVDVKSVGGITYNGYKDFRVNPKPRHRVNETDIFTLLDGNWGFAITSNTQLNPSVWTLGFYFVYVDTSGYYNWVYSDSAYCNYTHFPIDEWTEAIKYNLVFSFWPLNISGGYVLSNDWYSGKYHAISISIERCYGKSFKFL